MQQRSVRHGHGSRAVLVADFGLYTLKGGDVMEDAMVVLLLLVLIQGIIAMSNG